MLAATRFLALLVVAACLAPSSPAAELNKYLPEDTEIVVGINLTSLADAAVVQRCAPIFVKKFGTELLTLINNHQSIDPERLKEYRKLLDDPAIVRTFLDDARRLVQRVMIGASADFDEDSLFLIVEGNIDHEQLRSFCEGLAKSKPRLMFSTAKEGGREYFKLALKGKDESVFICVADKRTVMCCTDQKRLTRVLNRVADGKAASRKELVEVANRIDPKAGLWIAAAPKESDEYVNAVGYLLATDGLKLSASITTKDADAARSKARDVQGRMKDVDEELTEAAKQFPLLTPLKDMLKKIEPAAEKNKVNISLDLPPEAIDRLIRALPGLR